VNVPSSQKLIGAEHVIEKLRKPSGSFFVMVRMSSVQACAAPWEGYIDDGANAQLIIAQMWQEPYLWTSHSVNNTTHLSDVRISSAQSYVPVHFNTDGKAVLIAPGRSGPEFIIQSSGRGLEHRWTRVPAVCAGNGDLHKGGRTRVPGPPFPEGGSDPSSRGARGKRRPPQGGSDPGTPRPPSRRGVAP
jgi:hypothetical protein